MKGCLNVTSAHMQTASLLAQYSNFSRSTQAAKYGACRLHDFECQLEHHFQA